MLLRRRAYYKGHFLYYICFCACYIYIYVYKIIFGVLCYGVVLNNYNKYMLQEADNATIYYTTIVYIKFSVIIMNVIFPILC